MHGCIILFFSPFRFKVWLYNYGCGCHLAKTIQRSKTCSNITFHYEAHVSQSFMQQKSNYSFNFEQNKLQKYK
jgi:hypothetical protein